MANAVTAPAPARAQSRTAPPRFRRRTPLVAALPAAYVAVALFGTWWVDLSVASLAAGWEDTVRLLGRMFPPTFGAPGEIAALLVQTLLIALAGTGLAALASVPLAAAAASTFTGSRPVQVAARAAIVLTRAVPSLVFAIIFVRVFGLGPMAGGLAIAFHSVGMIAKMLADSFEEQDRLPAEAARAAGLNRLQVFAATVWSRAVPAFTSIVLYRLDINIRASAVLGLVGAGGIGVALQSAMGSLNYRRAAGIVLIIIALILLLEALSVAIQRRVSTHNRAGTNPVLLPAGPEPHRPGWDLRRGGRPGLGLGAAALFGYALWSLEADWLRVQDSLPNVWILVSGMFPPAFSA
ncbi:phosphonate ABC transporter, permease protein PhnE, partial [Arthrobacter deserti]|nr:phosphonate ABC transporter, permease protein PhnE [Arthrobacter deserti]